MGKEIELKARVKDRVLLEKTLSSFASFKGEITRDDVYYAHPSSSNVKIRIRKESDLKGTKYFLTYKKKENRLATHGVKTEVNEELETEIKDASVLETFLLDVGFSIVLTKKKEIHEWKANVFLEGKEIEASLELCNITPLGDFLEIEIVCETEKETDIEKAQTLLFELLEKSGLNKECIEERYYSELLKEAEQK